MISNLESTDSATRLALYTIPLGIVMLEPLIGVSPVRMGGLGHVIDVLDTLTMN